MAKVFKGANVFMSRNLVPPEQFDALHDALKLNGAQVFLCCDPSRNSPDDFHIISSSDHEKFEDLRSKGCNLLGPRCVLSCAKEYRPLPKQGFTCCLAMDGVKVLASGFEMEERVEIGKLVTAMGGVLHTKASLDVSFVIVKNVLAAKYKWALNLLKKPAVTIKWLHQCWKEHRLVPWESYRVLPFCGLTICVTRIPADERKEMEKIIIQNGGKYSAELTKKCTHLICDAPEGDKYKVARRWGHIHIISRKWFDQSTARKACLNEEAYPVQASPASSLNTARTMSQRSQDMGIGNLQHAPAISQGNLSAQVGDPDLAATASQNTCSTFPDEPILSKEQKELPDSHPKIASNFDGCVADDSQMEDNDLYLSDCRIILVGFEGSQIRKLVNMVRRGGGSRYMAFNEKLTHIVVGEPSDVEIKEVRSLAAWGVIYVVKTAWLEDCDREKKEVPVLQRHIASDLLLPKDHVYSNKKVAVDMASTIEGKSSATLSILVDDHASGYLNEHDMSSKMLKKPEFTISSEGSQVEKGNSAIRQPLHPFTGKPDKKTGNGTSNQIENRVSSNAFMGKLFRFSSSFPADRRAEVIEWVNQGGGTVVQNQIKTKVHFTVECHGVLPASADVNMGTYVSTHWIRSCLEDGHLLDVGTHILYSPLPCRIPFPGFENLRFCVSQYDERERMLLRNLCYVLGAKFAEKLTKKVSYLLCKFASGPKYEAASRWGIRPVTAEWIYACVEQGKLVTPDAFCPKEVTLEDREARFCTMTQYPTQAVQMLSGENASQIPTQSQEAKTMQTGASIGISATKEEVKYSDHNKKARLAEDDKLKCYVYSTSNQNSSTCSQDAAEKNLSAIAKQVSSAVPDVAAAIEDLLEQTTKIQDQKSPERSGCDKTLFASGCTIIGQDHGDASSALGLSKHWINRFGKDDTCDEIGDANAGTYDGFSETQTESQVVGYAEDLSGRQMIIDRVRTRGSMI